MRITEVSPAGVRLAIPADTETREVQLSVEDARILGWQLLDSVETLRVDASNAPALEGPMLRVRPHQIAVLIGSDHLTLSVAFKDWRPWQIELDDQQARDLANHIETVLAMPISARSTTRAN